MRLSFVMPTRKEAKFIRPCINRRPSQGIKDSELIIADDALNRWGTKNEMHKDIGCTPKLRDERYVVIGK